MSSSLVTLSEVAVLTPGFAFKSKDFGEHDTKVIKITDVADVCRSEKLTGVDIRPYANKNLEKYIVRRGDYYIAMTGSIGKVGRLASGCAYLNQRVLGIRAKQGVHPSFLWHVINTNSFLNHLRTHIDSHSVQANISASSVGKYRFSLPSLAIQQKISKILDAFDDAIELNNRINDYLTELGKMIWAQTANQAAKTVKIAEVAADIVTGKTPSTKKPDNYGEEYPFITIPDMHSAVWLCSTERCLSEAGNSSQPKKLVQRGSVLVSCIATVGLVGIVQKPSHFNQQINAVIPANEGDEFYLYYAMHSIKQELLGIGATGSATLNVNKGAFSNIEIPWPERSAMDTYVRTVEPLFKAIEANTLESLRLQELRDTLLPKLMSGEIDVSKVEI